MKHMALALVWFLSPFPALAQDSLDAREFDAYTRGKTFYYGTGSEPYGAEEYLPDQRVRWSFLDGKCKSGHWYQQDEQICFVYEDNPVPQCWRFFQESGGLVARFASDPMQTTLYELEQSTDPLTCLGPEVGV